MICFVDEEPRPVRGFLFLQGLYLCVMNSNIGEVLFHEKQRFARWLLLLVFLPAIISAVVILRCVNTGEEPASLIGLGVALATGALLSFVSLQTQVTKEGISVRFFPFVRKTTLFSFAEMESAEVIEYKPIKEYGGWGLRVGKNGVAYSVSGKKGVLITFKEPKKLFWGKHKTLLIGTQKPDDWREVLKEIWQ